MRILSFQAVPIALFVALFFTACNKGNIPAYGNEIVSSDSVLYKGILAGGEFGDIARGNVSIEKLSGVKYLVFKNFTSSNGPAVHVYLSSTTGNHDNPPADFIDLGLLKYTSGTFNYEVKGNPDIEKFRYVIVWCEKFNIQFGITELKK